jgi:uncharacterized RDD family membrane protein YckC
VLFAGGRGIGGLAQHLKVKEVRMAEARTPRKPRERIVVGFWLRFVADLLDAILLGVFGYLLVTSRLGSLLHDMGPAAVLVGVGIGFLYFGALQTSIGNGQSLAKKLLRIQVLKLDGSHMTLPISLARYGVIALAFYGGSIWDQLTTPHPGPADQTLATFVIFAAYLCLWIAVAPLVAFHPQKRGLHDLIAGTVVVPLNRFDGAKIAALHDPRKVNRAYYAVAIIGAIVIAGSWALLTALEQHASYMSRDEARAIEALEQTVEQETIVDDVSIEPTYARASFALKSEEKVIEFKLLVVRSKMFLQEDSASAVLAGIERSIEIIVQNLSDVASYQCIDFIVESGMDIGIYSYTSALDFVFDSAGKRIESNARHLRVPPFEPDNVPGCYIEKSSIADPIESVPELPFSWTIQAQLRDD